jgi:hypothetical protein
VFQLAFVSFTEFTNGVRCFLPIETENGGYVRSRIFTGLEQVNTLPGLCPKSTVVEHLIRNHKVKGFNPI